MLRIKKILFLLFVFINLLCFTACDDKKQDYINSDNDSDNQDYVSDNTQSEPQIAQVFIGKVVEVGDNYIIANPCKGSYELDYADKFIIYLDSESSSNSWQINDYVYIIYNKQIIAGAPAEFHTIYKLEELVIPIYDTVAAPNN